VLSTRIQLGSIAERAILRDPVVAADDIVYVERRSIDSRLIELAPGVPGRLVARLTNAHPDRTLLACETDGLICRELDDTLVSITREGGQRTVLRRLIPQPDEIVVTPEHVVWSAGKEIWRWWRENDAVERLGECERPPLLAVRPIEVPYPPSRMAADVAVAAGTRVGLIDIEGLDWIAETEEPVGMLACTTGQIVLGLKVARPDLASLMREPIWKLAACDLDSEQIEVVDEIDGRVMALVATEGTAFLGITVGPGELNIASTVSKLGLAKDALLQLPWSLDQPTMQRQRMDLAVSARGLVLVETLDWRTPPRVTFLPFRRDSEDATQTLRIQRWFPDGRGAEIKIAAQEWSAGAATGELPAGLTARVNDALKVTVSANERPPGGGYAGWQVSIGDHAAWCAATDHVSPSALAIARLVAILAPHVPPLAALAAL
jgi:hypothetical protein